MKVKKLSRERILSIANDVAEDMCSASRADMACVIKFYMTELYDEVQRRVAERTEIALKLLELGNDQLRLCRHSESKAKSKRKPITTNERA